MLYKSNTVAYDVTKITEGSQFHPSTGTIIKVLEKFIHDKIIYELI